MTEDNEEKVDGAEAAVEATESESTEASAEGESSDEGDAVTAE